MLANEKHSNFLIWLASYEENKALWKWPQVPDSQHFIFFLTYEYFQKARVLYYNRPEKLASGKHTNLLGPFVTYKENKVVYTAQGTVL